MVSESLLLEGSWYALEQAGRLLRAAVGVFDDGDPATGLVLAMLVASPTRRRLGCASRRPTSPGNVRIT